MGYISQAVKVKRECDIPVGGRYNARQTMDREMTGYRQGYQDMLESYDNFDQMRRRAKTEPRPQPCSGVSASKITAEKRLFSKPNIGMTEPRTEKYLGMVDVRKKLPGYIGGKRLRDFGFQKDLYGSAACYPSNGLKIVFIPKPP